MIRSIHMYPIKGTHRVTIQESRVEARGLVHDRRWMVVDGDGTFLTQREHASLARVQAQCGAALLVSAPGMPLLRVPRPKPEASRQRVRIWEDNVEACTGGERADQWFSRYLGRQCHLVYMDDHTKRQVDPAYDTGGSIVSFADGYPLLLTSMASLAALNARLEVPVPMTRFRPNLVVTGGEAFEEDRWSRIRVGEMEFHVVKSCTRCVVTTIDQETADQGKEPLRTLNRFRKRGGKVYFGENLIPAATGIIRAGDPVEVLAVRS